MKVLGSVRANRASPFLGLNISTKPSATKPHIRKGSLVRSVHFCNKLKNNVRTGQVDHRNFCGNRLTYIYIYIYIHIESCISPTLRFFYFAFLHILGLDSHIRFADRMRTQPASIPSHPANMSDVVVSPPRKTLKGVLFGRF